ncbi:hypothetical protein BKA64DRAFT_304066 [Cadophora sp. MPI-SDFR-AT-0126]|nr:hypothetical protein BKA64DRAFT_304066 [Leotiomycetes sp. MPI-SDFR-AT-0126]
MPTMPAKTPSRGASDATRKHPCVLCQQRKVKCDRNEPCANCVKARMECISPTTLPPKKRKKRFPEAELLARLRRYEDHLRAYGADIDAINAGGIVPLPVPAAKSPHDGAEAADPTASVDQHMRSVAIRRALKHTTHDPWTGVNEEFRDAEDILQGSSGDELYDKPITRTYDAIHSDGGDLLFSTPATERMIDLHPSTVQIFRLWQKFLDNVNPIVKLFHAPTVQLQILEASADLENVSKEMETLMFGIYAAAICSLSDTECTTMFGEEKEVLRLRYSGGARQALHRAGLLRTSNLTILQGFVLYLISCLNFHIDPRSLFCLTGIAVRIAQRMGLCYDGASYGLQPFEIEMRRRLWWQIMLLDFRVAEFSGAGCSILTHVWTTKFPLNVNDSDLYPDMRDPPAEHNGVTEMVYVLTLCEITSYFNKMRSSNISLQIKDKEIDDLAAHLEKTYLQYCDPSIPLHILSMLMARTRIAKLHMGPYHPYIVKSKTMGVAEKEALFSLSLQMLQDHNTLMGSNAMKNFFWHVVMNLPLPAHVYLLTALKTRVQDQMSDKAWDAFAEFFRLRMMLWERSDTVRQKKSALHAAFANLTVKAWDAREKALPGIEVPPMVSMMREEVRAKKSPKEPMNKTPPIAASSGSNGDIFTDSFSWMDQPNVGLGQVTDLGSGVMHGTMMGQDNSSVGMGMGWDFWTDFMPVYGSENTNGHEYGGGQNVYNS